MQNWILTAAIVLAVGVLGFWVYASASISSGVFIDAQCEIEPSEGILLTFDDGPDPEMTPKVLDVLDRHGQKAIFFVIGEKVDAHPEIVREIVRRGHQVGNHTYSHSPYANFLGREHLEEEIRKCGDAVERACGVRPTLFRPPLGICTHFMASALRNTGYRAVGWSVRSFDTCDDPREEVLERVVEEMEPGAIVLLHDRLERADWLAESVLEAWEKRVK